MLASPPAAPAAAFLSFDGIAHAYEVRGRAVPALAPVDLDVRRGELLSIIGPSGCGKSTLLRIAGGLLAPTEGTVRLGDASPRDAQRAKQIGFVFQDASLLPWRTVAANVRLALEVNRGAGRRELDIGELLALVGLEDVAGYYPHQLSGGMKQRVALARALALDPPLLLMDEPFGALDEITRTELRYELLRLRGRLRATVLFVTHSIAEAVLLSDRVAVMHGRPGRITAVIDTDLPDRDLPEIEETFAFLTLTRRLRAALRGG
jgi:NitT/TauT family transport system ATP-binding protein